MPPFHLDWILWLANHRSPPLTAVMEAFTFLGELGAIVPIVALVFAVFDKRLAIRLAFVALIAGSLNYFLKVLVANPRPFVSAGTYRQEWAVSPRMADALAIEYSTPSGHAMGGAAFWGVLFGRASGGWARAACALAILGTGLSRPYLGVHYVEDILLGWPLGLAIAWVVTRWGDGMARRWDAHAFERRVVAAVGASVGLWAVTRALGGLGTATGQPNAFVSYAGFLTGLVVAEPLEAHFVGFDPRRSSGAVKALRFVFVVVGIVGPLVLLDRPFAAIAPDSTPLGDLLRYLRYGSASVAGLFAVPLLCTRLGLAERSGEASAALAGHADAPAVDRQPAFRE